VSVMVVDRIAQEIRRVDGGNRMTSYQLADALLDFMYREGLIDADRLMPAAIFLTQVNENKQLGAGRLAEMLMEEFDLEEVTT
jgi:hypothetical protein